MVVVQGETPEIGVIYMNIKYIIWGIMDITIS